MHTPSHPRRVPGCALSSVVLAAAALGAPAARAQDSGARAPALSSSISAEQTLLETRSSPQGNGLEAITRLSPSIRYAVNAGQLKGSLEYTANLLYRRGRAESSGGEWQNELNADFIAEAIPNHAFIQARATTSQQTISAFGQQTVQGALRDNDNQAEITTVSVSPWLQGSLGRQADYELRALLGTTRSGDSDAPRSNNKQLSLNLRSARSAALLGWAVNASQQRVDFKGAPGNENDRVDAALTITPDPSLLLSLNGGRELNDDGRSQRVVANTYGAGLRWAPSMRTSLDVGADKRYFGHSGHVSFDHRAPRSAWHYGYSRDINNSNSTNGQPFTLYELLYAQAASTYPDPAVRQQQVLAYIQAMGLDPNTIAGGGSLTSSVTLLRRHDVSVAWLGVRTTFNLQAFSSATSSLVDTPSSTDPAAGETVQQFGYTATLSYRLTPVVTVNLLGSLQKTLNTPTRAGNNLKSASLNFSQQISPRTSAMLGARYTVFNSPTDPYRETAVSGSLSLRF